MLFLIVAAMVMIDVLFLIIVSVNDWRLSLNILLVIRNVSVHACKQARFNIYG